MGGNGAANRGLIKIETLSWASIGSRAAIEEARAKLLLPLCVQDWNWKSVEVREGEREVAISSAALWKNEIAPAASCERVTSAHPPPHLNYLPLHKRSVQPTKRALIKMIDLRPPLFVSSQDLRENSNHLLRTQSSGALGARCAQAPLVSREDEPLAGQLADHGGPLSLYLRSSRISFRSGGFGPVVCAANRASELSQPAPSQLPSRSLVGQEREIEREKRNERDFSRSLERDTNAASRRQLALVAHTRQKKERKTRALSPAIPSLHLRAQAAKKRLSHWLAGWLAGWQSSLDRRDLCSCGQLCARSQRTPSSRQARERERQTSQVDLCCTCCLRSPISTRFSGGKRGKGNKKRVLIFARRQLSLSPFVSGRPASGPMDGTQIKGGQFVPIRLDFAELASER